MRDPHRRTPTLPLAVLLLTLAAACGDADVQEVEPADAPAAEAPAAATAPPAGEEPFVFAVADLDTYERGVAVENEMLRGAVERLQSAEAGSDTLGTLFSILPERTEAEAARETGVPVERYRQVKEEVMRVLGTREMGAAMRGELTQVDTTGMPEEVKAQLRESLAQAEAAWGNPYEGLSPEVVQAFREREDRLSALRGENLRLLMQLSGG